MTARLFMVIGMAFFISGCATSPQKVSPVNELQNQVVDLQQRLEQQEKEVVDLKYEIQEMSDKMAEKKVVEIEASAEVPQAVKTTSVSVDMNAAGVIKATGVSVADVQKALQGSGLYDGKIDGKIGPKTRSGIIDFQKQHGLKSDGVVGQKTWAAMKTYIPVE